MSISSESEASHEVIDLTKDNEEVVDLTDYEDNCGTVGNNSGRKGGETWMQTWYGHQAMFSFKPNGLYDIQIFAYHLDDTEPDHMRDVPEWVLENELKWR